MPKCVKVCWRRVVISTVWTALIHDRFGQTQQLSVVVLFCIITANVFVDDQLPTLILTSLKPAQTTATIDPLAPPFLRLYTCFSCAFSSSQNE